MSTVKIKTEPTTAAAAAAVVDVQVKLEPSLSTADIKLEQHSSDLDTKVEPDSEADSEEGEDTDGDTEQNQFTITPRKQRQFICKHPGCGHRFKTTSSLNMHRYEHRLQADIIIFGKTYTLTRQSLNSRWACPIPDCTLTYISVNVVRTHIQTTHGNTVKQQQDQQPPAQLIRPNHYFVGVDNFYVKDVRCGYHNTAGVFICHECRLVPECLLAHLKQKHGYGEKLIDTSALPESAVNISADPNGNQHTSNSHLAAAISNPYQQQQHQDVVQGWLCAAANCGYCSYTAQNKVYHKRMHHGEQISTVPALALRLSSSKTHTSCFLITRIDQASGAVTASSNKVSRRNLNYSHNELNSQDENGDDVSQSETAEQSNQRRQWVCEYEDCRRFFNSAAHLSEHRREHKLEVEIVILGKTFTLTRQSSEDRWACPVPDCESTCKTVCTSRMHIQYVHCQSLKQRRANMEEDDSQQQPTIKRRQRAMNYLNVNDFYISGTKCGYHNAIGAFMCYSCRLIPECLLMHLQQKHEYDEKSIDNAFLPEGARIAGSDPNGNQHVSNQHLASVICKTDQLQHPDVVQGWLCIKPDCGFCYPNKKTINEHQCREHKGEQQVTVPALVLRLLYGKTQSSYFLITRLDTITSSTKPANSASQHNNECDDEDGDELVLSDYSD